MALLASNWIEFLATGPGFNLPATGVEFKVPTLIPDLYITPTSTPTANQIGYTIIGTTTEVAPIALASTVGATIRSVTLTPGTWLVTGMVNAKAITDTVVLDNFIISFSSTAGTHAMEQIGSELAGTGIPVGGYWGNSITAVYQVAANTVVELDVVAGYTGAGSLTASETDDIYTRMTATRLS